MEMPRPERWLGAGGACGCFGKYDTGVSGTKHVPKTWMIWMFHQEKWWFYSDFMGISWGFHGKIGIRINLAWILCSELMRSQCLMHFEICLCMMTWKQMILILQCEILPTKLGIFLVTSSNTVDFPTKKSCHKFTTPLRRLAKFIGWFGFGGFGLAM